jgi:hypothetical protein
MANADIPEDPWGHTNVEAQYPWSMIGRYRFVETVNILATERIRNSRLYNHSMKTPPSPADRIALFYGYDGRELASFRKTFSIAPQSQFGFTWAEKRTLIDRALNVYPGEVLAKNIATDETLAVMRGFFRVRPMRACPGGKDDFFVVRFLEKVLRPAGGTVRKE